MRLLMGFSRAFLCMVTLPAIEYGEVFGGHAMKLQVHRWPRLCLGAIAPMRKAFADSTARVGQNQTRGLKSGPATLEDVRVPSDHQTQP